jgi:hypothetical protein
MQPPSAALETFNTASAAWRYLWIDLVILHLHRIRRSLKEESEFISDDSLRRRESGSGILLDTARGRLKVKRRDPPTPRWQMMPMLEPFASSQSRRSSNLDAQALCGFSVVAE